MKAVDKLDAVLQFMASNEQAIKNVQYDEIRSQLIDKFPELSDDDNWGNDIYRILRKLDNEGYIVIFKQDVYPEPALNFSVKEKRYIVTFDGKLFSEQGGYKVKYKKERSKLIYQRLALWLTAIGTMLAGLYGVFEIARWANIIS